MELGCGVEYGLPWSKTSVDWSKPSMRAPLSFSRFYRVVGQIPCRDQSAHANGIYEGSVIEKLVEIRNSRWMTRDNEVIAAVRIEAG